MRYGGDAENRLQLKLWLHEGNVCIADCSFFIIAQWIYFVSLNLFILINIKIRVIIVPPFKRTYCTNCEAVIA